MVLTLCVSSFSQNDHGRVREAFTKSLAKLGVDYVDLYLMHWPIAYDASGALRDAQREHLSLMTEDYCLQAELYSLMKAQRLLRRGGKWRNYS